MFIISFKFIPYPVIKTIIYKMLLKDRHDQTRNTKIFHVEKHHRPLPLPLPLPLLLLLKFSSKNLSTCLRLVINSFRLLNNLCLSPVMIWNFSQRHKTQIAIFASRLVWSASFNYQPLNFKILFLIFRFSDNRR